MKYTRGNNFYRRLTARLYEWVRESLQAVRYWFETGYPDRALRRLQEADRWRASARFYRAMG